MHRIVALSLLLTLSFFSCTSSPKGKVLDASAFQKLMNDTKDKVVLDVRTPGEFKEGYIKDARNLDWNNSSFMSEAGKLDKSKPTFVYCLSGGRSHSAANALRDMGFSDVYELDGGIMQWRRAGLPLETAG
ncbi:MAG: rhodanese-like domain-containing protein, partial [Chitinophagaceae bacterium]|nr:rhodanese-like domain-containing protein [Chitinophagaceae bacterium]